MSPAKAPTVRLRVGGLNHEEIKRAVEELKKKRVRLHVEKEIAGVSGRPKIFGLDTPEFTVELQKEHVLKLLEVRGLRVGQCRGL